MIRLKRSKETKNCIVYSEGFFGGLFRNDLALEVNQLRQRFGGRVPDVIDIEITEPEQVPDPGKAARDEAIQEKRTATRDALNEMQVKGAIARLEKKWGK